MHAFSIRAKGAWALSALLFLGFMGLLGTWPYANAQALNGVAHGHGVQHAQPTQPAQPPVAASPPEAEPPSQIRIWKDANQAVSEFPRGHADVLRWEQKNTPQANVTPDKAARSLSLERAMQMALQDPVVWLEPGMSAVELTENRQKRAVVRFAVQKRWVDAVASQQAVMHSQQILAAAQAGAELAQRMARVGNWSRAQQIQEELLLWDAQHRSDQAQLQAERTLVALWQQIGMKMSVQDLAQQLPLHLPTPLPLTWPDDASLLPLDDVAAVQAQALKSHVLWASQELQAQRLMVGLGPASAQMEALRRFMDAQEAWQAPVFDPRTMRWGHAVERAWQAKSQADRLARQVRGDAQMAVAAYRVARQRAQVSQAEVLRLHTQSAQETLLRYNGMLKSTWALLASARTQIQSVDAVLDAQRQAWLAHADLTAVLSGLPYAASPDSAGLSKDAPNNTAGH